MYLLDTDVLSNLSRRSPAAYLIVKMASIPQEQQFTSSVTAAELVYGAYRFKPRTAALLERISAILSNYMPVLPFDREAAYRYGQIRADLESKGTPIGDADLRIASIALARNLTVVTGNIVHFRRVPDLPVENWLEP